MIVMKFGGTSIGSAEQIRKATAIVRSRMGKGNPIVVVSALSGVTDALIALANGPQAGRHAEGKLDWIRERHYKVISDLRLEKGLIDKELSQLDKSASRINGPGDITPKVLDTIMSFGERMSSRIIAAHMAESGIPAAACDAYDAGMLTNSDFGNADILPGAYRLIRAALGKDGPDLHVVTGFIGKNGRGEITTLGRGGSDYTASIIGAAVGAERIEIWTDVDGIMTADPRIVKSARNVRLVSYAEASELAFIGAKVLHPKTILPAISKNIPVRILNTFNPSHRGTTIVRCIGNRKRIASIACKRRISVINIHTPKMFLMHGFLRRVFETFDMFGLSVDMVSTSEVNVSVTLDQRHDTRGLVKELEKIAEVEIKSNMAMVSVVGNGLAYRTDLLSRIFSTLSSVAVEMTSSSTSEINQSLVVKDGDADDAVRHLHKAFFGS